MFANSITRSIEMYKTEAAKAGKLGTEEFKALAALKAIYSDYKIEIIAKKAKSRHFSRDFIRTYVKNHGSDEQKDELEKYESAIAKADQDNCNNNYLKLRGWFMREFADDFGIKAKAKSKEENAEKEKKVSKEEDAA